MNSRKFSQFVLPVFALILTGCTSFKISPQIESIKGETVEIKSYSFSVEAPYKNHFFEQDAREITKAVLNASRQTDTTTNEQNEVHFAISLKQRSHGGACGQDYLTGLSLGIIPSWCTRPEMYKFNFKLLKNGEICSSKEYVVDETSYAHLILLPFGLLELATGVYSEALDLYKKSLLSFINQSHC